MSAHESLRPNESEGLNLRQLLLILVMLRLMAKFAYDHCHGTIFSVIASVYMEVKIVMSVMASDLKYELTQDGAKLLR